MLGAEPQGRHTFTLLRMKPVSRDTSHCLLVSRPFFFYDPRSDSKVGEVGEGRLPHLPHLDLGEDSVE